MLNKLMLLAIIFALVLSLGFVIACGDDDDDDDDATDDDDDDDDDDDATACDWTEELTWMVVDCEVIFEDTEGNEMTLAEVLADCNVCIGECAWAYIDIPDCDGAIDCVVADCF